MLDVVKVPAGAKDNWTALATLGKLRLKRSGMRRRQRAGEAVLTLRALVQRDRFDPGWALLAAAFRAEVVVPEDVTARSLGGGPRA
jgi:hypothetical protein